jgi:hypothetical protein
MPLLQTILNIVGISSLIGTVLAHLLSSRREQRVWVKDNKKAEWRELIETLDKCFAQMFKAFGPEYFTKSDEPYEGMENGDLVIQNRIFIAETLKASGIIEKWKEIVDCVNRPQSELPDYSYYCKVQTFKEALLQVARKDLVYKLNRVQG